MYNKVPSLVQIARAKLMHNVSYIDDTGPTPFRLLEPVLQRMNAKQLQRIEATSPQIMPESDALWLKLIEKDFPTRPLTIKIVSAHSMPHKDLYDKYVHDRESFRQDSTKRLRKINERLKLEKLANQIVKVQELLKDPTVRRRPIRTPSSYSYSRTLPKNSILGKARRDLQGRLLMFTTGSTKKYDAFDAFKAVKLPPKHVYTPRTITRVSRFGPDRPQPSEEALKLIEKARDHKKPTPEPLSPPVLEAEPLSDSGSSPRKRKQPSVFLIRKRPSRPLRRPPPPPPPSTDVEEPQQPSRIKAIKSSVFN